MYSHYGGSLSLDGILSKATFLLESSTISDSLADNYTAEEGHYVVARVQSNIFARLLHQKLH